MAQKWTLEELQIQALRYRSRGDFSKQNMAAYLAAKRRGVLEQICAHMPTHVNQTGENNPNSKWTFEKLKEEALKYKTKQEFQKNDQAAYLAATRREDYKDIVAHMPNRKNIVGENNPNFKWTFEKLKEEALKYNSIGEFQKNNGSAYVTVRNLNLEEQIYSHMKKRNFLGENNLNFKWTYESLKIEALKYNTLVEFQNKSRGAYQCAISRKILNEICSHMKPSHGSSMDEKFILKGIQKKFEKAQQFRTKRIDIPFKPHIKMLEIDIYVPELRKGIEFDGEYWHSDSGLKRSRSHWPQEDIDNYHSIKDDYFQSLGIQILHIKEEDWKKDKIDCASKIKNFLNIYENIFDFEEKVE